MSPVDKAALLAKRGLGTETVQIEGVGEVVVRGMSRAEALSLQKLGDLDAAEMERHLVSMAMVEPALTEDEVRQWQEAAPAGELEPVSEAIQRLSGLAVKQVKEEMKRFRR